MNLRFLVGSDERERLLLVYRFSDFMIPMIIILELKFDSCIYIYICLLLLLCLYIRSFAAPRERPDPLPASLNGSEFKVLISENPPTGYLRSKYAAFPSPYHVLAAEQSSLTSWQSIMALPPPAPPSSRRAADLSGLLCPLTFERNHFVHPSHL